MLVGAGRPQVHPERRNAHHGEDAMAEREVDVGAVLEESRLGRFHLLTVALCFLVVVVDGLDFGAGNVAAPAILKSFGAERSQMGLVFGWMYSRHPHRQRSSSAMVGDRFGRRAGAILGVLTYSLPALATGFADSMPQLMLLRFVTGLGIGGVIPNVIALATENAPRRYRASLVILVFLGLCGRVGHRAGQIARRRGPCRSMAGRWCFWSRDRAGTVLSVVLAAFLPESVRWLALKKPIVGAAARGRCACSRRSSRAGATNALRPAPGNEERALLDYGFSSPATSGRRRRCCGSPTSPNRSPS